MSGTEAKAPRILLGVTTYNRLETVALAARSLRHAEGLEEVGIVVIDDASEDYGLEALRPLFPPQTEFVRRAANSGRADYAAHGLMRHFIEKRREDLLVCLDSDLVVARDFLARIRAAWPATDGVLSLFNAHTHPGAPSGRGEGLLVKEAVGFAGTVWARPVIADALIHVVPTPRFDWDICKRLEETGRAILCLENSAVQHIGMVGQNSRFLTSDYGLGFADDHWANLAAIQEVTLFGARKEIAALRRQVETLRKDVAMLRVKAAVAALRKKG
ncbi:glycosyltransferase [Acetobacteraceae bacterium H6797]|nr:glycosyltransferase [Acetobacteraceae bacterium H6797]